jgi:hypothetical protein
MAACVDAAVRLFGDAQMATKNGGRLHDLEVETS